jgi:hypothetical protein
MLFNSFGHHTLLGILSKKKSSIFSYSSHNTSLSTLVGAFYYLVRVAMRLLPFRDIPSQGKAWWFTSVIPATQEATGRKITL